MTDVDALKCKLDQLWDVFASDAGSEKCDRCPHLHYQHEMPDEPGGYTCEGSTMECPRIENAVSEL